jgi:hypothetical protein
MRASGIRTGLIDNLSTARSPARAAIGDEREPGTKKIGGSDPFVEWELAVAYCCGQTGGSSVIASEITGHFSVHGLWTGDADV